MQPQVFHFHYQNIGIDIPYYEFIGKKPGPHIIISGGMHGDEINGISIVRKFLGTCIEGHIEKHLSGKVIVIPILNPTGFNSMNRYVTIDQKDPNRSFGYKTKKFKTYTNYWCDSMIEKFRSKCDYAIDIHDGGLRGSLIPHSRIHLCESNTCNNCTHEMAKYMDTQVVLERKGQKNMLAVHLQQQFDIPLLTVELGGSQITYTLYHDDILRGIKNILIHYGLLSGEIKMLHGTIQKTFQNRSFYTAKHSGELYLYKQLGEHVKKGEILGKIFYNTLNKSEIIKSKNNGIVFSQRPSNQIKAGEKYLSIIN